MIREVDTKKKKKEKEEAGKEWKTWKMKKDWKEEKKERNNAQQMMAKEMVITVIREERINKSKRRLKEVRKASRWNQTLVHNITGEEGNDPPGKKNWWWVWE